MDELKISHLLARHSTRDMDKLEFCRRVPAEHLFLSVDEVFNYLNKIVTNDPLNPDDPEFVSYKDSPILVINIIDEAVCSIAYEILHQISLGDKNMLAYIRHRISDFRDLIMNKIAHKDKDNYPFYNDLFTMMMVLDFLSFPVYHREESLPHQVVYAYYSLMSCLYLNARPKDEYFTKLYKYYESKKV